VKIIVFGAGTQGTLFGVRLARVGHAVTLVARGQRVGELREHGAIIEHALTGNRQVEQLPVAETLSEDMQADLCLVTVRREQLGETLPALSAARHIDRILFMVNHACGSSALFGALGRQRTVLGFPGAAGSIEKGVDRYVELSEQPTVLETTAPDIAMVLRAAGFQVAPIHDMVSWLRRHAVFVTAISAALYSVGINVQQLSADSRRVRDLIVGIRQGWAAMDRLAIAPAPLALRAIFQWVPMPFAVLYWQRLLRSYKGEYYFARHARHAIKEMAALAADVRALLADETLPQLQQLYGAIDAAVATAP
jgi:2-dehydropantoate 2-reductase